MDESGHRYRLYGVTVASSFPFRYSLEGSSGQPDLQFVYHGVAPESTFESTPAGTEVYRTPQQNADGESVMKLFSEVGAESILFPGVAIFRCLPTEIHAFAFKKRLEYLVEICFIGNVMSYWLERSGRTPLHASAVVVDGGAVAFMDGRSRGKTTTACALLAAGHPLLSDDILVIDGDGESLFGQPAYPQMKLLPEQLIYLGFQTGGYEKVHPDFDKLRVRIGPKGICSYHNSPVPLYCFYLLDREVDSDLDTSVELVDSGAALIELVKHSFAAELIDSVDRSPARLARLAAVAESVPMKRLRIPAGYDQLDPVRAVVLADIMDRK